jgi:hypothetical protein
VLSHVDVDLGVCFVGVPVEREIVVHNKTMLPAVFRWSPECICAGSEPGLVSGMGGGTGRGLGEEAEAKGALDFQCDWPEDEVPPGGSRTVRFLFMPRRSCAGYSSVVVCDVDGAASPTGFALTAQIQGLGVEYDILRSGCVVAGDGEAVATASVMNDSVAVDFGDECAIRQHVTMEIVIRNLTAMEVNVDLECDKLGVDDDTAVRVMECQAAAIGRDAAGLGGGGVVPVGARSVGGLGAGDGMVAAAMQRTTIIAEASFTSTVFGAASTMGPEGIRATFKAHPPATPPATNTGRMSVSGGGGGGVTGGRLAGAGDLSATSVGNEGLASRVSRVSFAGSVGGYSRSAMGSLGGDPSALALAGGGSTGGYAARRPGTGGTSASRAGSRPVLGTEHERVAFSRGLGVQMEATRRAHDADASALSKNNGAAVLIYPSVGILPPHGEFRAILTLVSNMPGEYFDTLRSKPLTLQILTPLLLNLKP